MHCFWKYGHCFMYSFYTFLLPLVDFVCSHFFLLFHVVQEHKYFEDAFRVYERGVKIFKYPHVKDIWVTYLSKFVKRYGKTKLERARELFENAVETVCTSLAFLSMLIVTCMSCISVWQLSAYESG